MLARCPRLETARRHGGAFAHMIRDLRGNVLPAWMDAVLAAVTARGYAALEQRST
jgi:hypothetical protein